MGVTVAAPRPPARPPPSICPSHVDLHHRRARRLPQIYREFEHTITNADKEKDLRWWSNNHGVNMPMNWPAFEVGDAAAEAAVVLALTAGQRLGSSLRPVLSLYVRGQTDRPGPDCLVYVLPVYA